MASRNTFDRKFAWTVKLRNTVSKAGFETTCHYKTYTQFNSAVVCVLRYNPTLINYIHEFCMRLRSAITDDEFHYSVFSSLSYRSEILDSVFLQELN